MGMIKTTWIGSSLGVINWHRQKILAFLMRCQDTINGSLLTLFTKPDLPRGSYDHVDAVFVFVVVSDF